MVQILRHFLPAALPALAIVCLLAAPVAAQDDEVVASQDFEPVPADATAEDMADGRYNGWEFRSGILAHDIGLFSGSKEDEIDIHAQLMAPSPGFLSIIGSPRPLVGLNLASDGISQVFAGLGWDIYFADRWFLATEFGGAIHNGDELGDPINEDPDERYLGCRALFRLGVGLGYEINDRVNLQLYADHISNANICERNEGLENAGVRMGYRF